MFHLFSVLSLNLNSQFLVTFNTLILTWGGGGEGDKKSYVRKGLVESTKWPILLTLSTIFMLT
jgi:hypothetical protein